MSTFTGTYTGGITLLTGTTTNPVLLTGSVSVGNTNVSTLINPADGVYGQTGTSWTVSNFGSIRVTGSYSSGINLAAGGVVNNGSAGATGAYILGGRHGVKIAGTAGTVNNYGTILGGKYFTGTAGGNNSAAIYLGSGGSVANSGLVMATGTAHAGVAVFNAIGSVSNLGTIVGATAGGGIHLHVGGNVSNGSTGVTKAVIAGGGVGVRISAAPGTVTNFATIANTVATAGAGVYLEAGGVVVNQASGTIAGKADGVAFANTAGTVVNLGTIAAIGANIAGVYLAAGGYVKNSGLISGAFLGTSPHGILVTSATGTVINSGSISGTVALRVGGTITNNTGGAITSNQDAVAVSGSAGVVINAGLLKVTATTAGQAVYLGAGGTLANQSTGTISAVKNDVVILNTAATVTNSGSILHTGTNTAVYSRAGGLVTNSSGALIQSTRTGIDFNNTVGTTGSFGTVLNSGSIVSTAAGTSGVAVYLGKGGVLTNQSTGVITAYRGAVSIAGSAGTVTNLGTLQTTGTVSPDVFSSAGGTLTNKGLIVSSSGGVNFNTVAGTVDNFGTVISTLPPGTAKGAGIYLGAGGVVVNEAGGLISAARAAVSLGFFGTTSAAATINNAGVMIGGYGITIGVADTGSNTIINAGTIIGTSGTAVEFGGGSNSLVFLNSSSSALQGVVGNVLPGDSFDLTFMTFSNTGAATVVSNGTVSQRLDVVENGATFSIGLDPNQNFSGDIFQLSTDLGGGTLVTEQPVCFCRGTRILTERGEVAVEDLAVGDQVMTVSGALKPICWIGFGRDLVTQRNSLARPIIVREGALADGVPYRDLYLTHGHALYLGGVLIPVENLVNHRSILWDESARVVDYYHIELADHDVLLADGAAAESYYDAGNRALFHNARPGSDAGAARPTFAPVLSGGDVVGRIWTALFERAGGRIEADTTDDPDLHLRVDGARLDPAEREGDLYTFVLQRPPAGALRLCSRTGVPSLLGQGRSDHRPLGVAITQIVLDQSGIATYFDYDLPQLREGGCYKHEDGFCWTDGELLLPSRFLPRLARPFTLTVQTQPHPDLRYPLPTSAAQAA